MSIAHQSVLQSWTQRLTESQAAASVSSAVKSLWIAVFGSKLYSLSDDSEPNPAVMGKARGQSRKRTSVRSKPLGAYFVMIELVSQ